MIITGKDSIKKYLLDILDNNLSNELYSILIGKPIVYYFGEEFAEKFMKKRVEKKIFLKSLRLTHENFD